MKNVVHVLIFSLIIIAFVLFALANQEATAGFFRDLLGRPFIAGILRYPDPAIVTKALAHQGQLGLIGAVDRNTGRVDLNKARIAEQRAFFMTAPSGSAIGIDRVG